jgi:hypothetical protein
LARLFYGTRERVPFPVWQPEDNGKGFVAGCEQFASHPSQKREGWGTRSVWLVEARQRQKTTEADPCGMTNKGQRAKVTAKGEGNCNGDAYGRKGNG